MSPLWHKDHKIQFRTRQRQSQMITSTLRVEGWQKMKSDTNARIKPSLNHLSWIFLNTLLYRWNDWSSNVFWNSPMKTDRKSGARNSSRTEDLKLLFSTEKNRAQIIDIQLSLNYVITFLLLLPVSAVLITMKNKMLTLRRVLLNQHSDRFLDRAWFRV